MIIVNLPKGAYSPMKPYDDYLSPFPGFDDLHVDDSIEHTIRAYVLTRLTRDYLHNVADSLPAENYQRLIKRITADLHATRRYLTSQNVKVAGVPEDDGVLVQWRWWHGMRTSATGGTRTVLKTEIQRLLAYYGRMKDE
jgi:hypothetical protein